MLPWYGYALLSAVFSAAFFIARKKGLSKEHSLPFDSTRFLVQAGVLLMLAPFIEFRFSLPLVGLIFVMSIVLAVAVRLIGKSLRHEDISSLAPLQNITPVLVFIWATFFLGEPLTGKHASGVALLIVGAYVLEVDKSFRGFISPFKKLGGHYVRLFVIAMILISVTATVEKFVLNQVHAPLELLFYSWIFIALHLNVYEAWRTKGFGYVRHAFRTAGVMVFVVALLALSAIGLYYQAISLGLVSLALPIKRLETLISTVVGGELFHDHGLKWKIAGCVIMLVGVWLII